MLVHKAPKISALDRRSPAYPGAFPGPPRCRHQRHSPMKFPRKSSRGSMDSGPQMGIRSRCGAIRILRMHHVRRCAFFQCGVLEHRADCARCHLCDRNGQSADGRPTGRRPGISSSCSTCSSTLPERSGTLMRGSWTARTVVIRGWRIAQEDQPDRDPDQECDWQRKPRPDHFLSFGKRAVAA